MPVEVFAQGACDCHVHVYGPFERYARVDGKYAPDKPYSVEDLFAMWERIGVQRGVIVESNNGGPGNEMALDTLRQFPSRLRGVAARKADVSDRALDTLADAGFRGIRFNLMRQDGKVLSTTGPGLEDLRALAPRMAERGWHAQLWIESGDLMQLADDLERLPVDFVIDHQSRTMADKGVDYPGFAWFLERLQSGRYWCKLSGADRNTRTGPPYADTDPFIRALASANPDRLVWGTDWPHVGHASGVLPDDQVLADYFVRNIPDAATRHKILVANPTRLYGFDNT